MFRALLAAQLLCLAAAYPNFPDKIPNGRRVPCWEGAVSCTDFCTGVGHTSCAGGYVDPTTNPFGAAFQAANFMWTAELCGADSDGDGFTNGQELGDPCCQWQEGESTTHDAVSHPGFSESMMDVGTPTCGGGGPPIEREFAPTQGRLSGFNPGEEQRSMDFIVANFTLPRIETTYVNFRFNFDDEDHDVYHITYGHALVALPRNLHHFVVTGCSRKTDQSEVGKPQWYGGMCDMPLGGFAGWAPGAVLWDVPKNTGIPIGKGVGIVGIEIEVHYTDAQLVAEALISTDGIRVFYTPTLRPYAAMSLQVLGMGAHDQLTIPPGEERFMIQRTCTVIDWNDAECFDYHADAIMIGQWLNMSVSGCGGLLDLCHIPGEDSASMSIKTSMEKYCSKTCGFCQPSAPIGNSTGERSDVPEGYRKAADGYCCSEGAGYPNYPFDISNPPSGSLGDCVNMCNDRADCVGFTYVKEEQHCWWATSYPESMNTVPAPGMSVFIKITDADSMKIHRNGEGGECNEEMWSGEFGEEFALAVPCGECKVMNRDDIGSCDDRCEAAGRLCTWAWSTTMGCNEDVWADISCSDEVDDSVCQCGDIVDESVNTQLTFVWDYMHRGSKPPLGELNYSSSFYHAHLIGREMYLSHLRDGEWRDMASQPHWNFNYQAVFPVEDATVKAGDVMHAACVFNSSSRYSDTPIGLSTYEEMCFSMGQVIYPLGEEKFLPYSSIFSCTGGVIWTSPMKGNHDPIEDPARFLRAHPWYGPADTDGMPVAEARGRSIYAADDGGETENGGLCSKYFHLIKGTKCSGDGTWERNGCDVFFEEGQWEVATTIMADRCMDAFDTYMRCMDLWQCTDADEWAEEELAHLHGRRNMRMKQICGDNMASCECMVAKDPAMCRRSNTCEDHCNDLERNPCEVDDTSCECMSQYDYSFCNCRWADHGCGYCDGFCTDDPPVGHCSKRASIPRWMVAEYGAKEC